MKLEPGLLEGSEKWADGSNRHTQTLSFIMALEADDLRRVWADFPFGRTTLNGDAG